MAFHIKITRSGSVGGTLYWISIPNVYSPSDTQSNGRVDAEDLVQDLQPSGLGRPCTVANEDCAVKQVWRWDASSGEYEIWTGGSDTGTPFTVAPGEGYGIVVQEVAGVSNHAFDVVGAHDPEFELSSCWAPGGVNMRWIALPPHLSIDTSFGIENVLDAEDLGRAMGGPSRVFQVRRLNESTGVFESWVVGSSYGTPFPVETDRAYAVDLSCPSPEGGCAECTWTWAPEHF